jgi:hypothetical protein
MLKNLTIVCLTIIALFFAAMYVRTYNDLRKCFISAGGWAAIAGDNQAEVDYMNNDIKTEHYQDTADIKVETDRMRQKIWKYSWSRFSNAYIRRINNLNNDDE